MDRRTDATELLDGRLDDPRALAGNLRDLGRINRWLGGVAMSADAIDALAAHRADLTLLDVGTGGADIPVALLERAAARGRRWSVVALDSRPEVLAAAAIVRPGLATTDGLELHVGDGRSLPYPDRSFDVAHCSLVVHHCTPDEAVALFREMARVARSGVVINDLDRSRLGWIGAWLLGHLLTRNRYTRTDAPLSVARAYRPPRDRGDAPDGRPDPGPDDPWLVRPALCHRGPADARCARRGIATRPAGRRRMSLERLGVAIVGGGPAGAVLATRLARAGVDVTLFERSPGWQWRAGGVFASPAAMTALERAGLDAATLDAVARPIPAMRVETPGGTTFRLTYGTETGGRPAVGFDRSRLDPALLELAAGTGADVRSGWHVADVDLKAGRLEVRDPGGAPRSIVASVVVGADGPHSVVALAAGVARTARLPPRIGLTYHLADPDPTASRDARMRVLDDGYVGVAPVAGGRVNIGIVLGRSWRAALSSDGARAVAAGIVAAIPSTDGDQAAWRHGEPLDTVAGAWPLGHRVTRRAGRGWLLVGDAAGFLDPFTGEGLHRALVSAELAAGAIAAHDRGREGAFGAYERAMQRRFLAKDAVSWLVQGFLGQPALFDYAARRVAARPAVRATMGLVMGDLVPAGRALDPRFLAALLAP